MRRNYKINFHQEYFLFLLPLFFVLHGFTDNFPLIKETDCFFLLLQYLVVSLSLYLIFFLLLHSRRKAAIFVFSVMSFYFFFGFIHDTAKSLFANTFLVQYSFILPLAFIFFIGLFIYLRKTQKSFSGFSRYINLLLCILIVIDLFQLTISIIKLPKQKGSIPEGFIKCDSCSKPDIFFIVADEYAGKRELQDILHFDNSDFEDALKRRGFFVADSSFSNYNYTPFSIASTLSLNFLKGIEGKSQSKNDRHICYSAINNNKLTGYLKAESYTFKNLSIFEFDDVLPEVSSEFVLSGKDLLTSQTFLMRLNRDIRFNLLTRYKNKFEIERRINDHLNTLQYLFDATKKEASHTSANPRFIYTHLTIPHYPYLLDKNGNKTNPDMLLEGNQVNQKAYIDYLQYANTKFIDLLDAILKNSKKPPIIIFMGDHGFRHFLSDVDHNYYFMNFCSIYLPGGNYGQFYKGMSLVNLFRVLFNSEFHQHLPLLKDSTIFLKE